VEESLTLEAGEEYGIRFRLSDGSSAFYEVLTAGPLETQTIKCDLDPGALPVVGDLAMFGVLGGETIEAVVRHVTRGANHSGTLTLVDHAPQIDSLTDAEVPPAWDGRAGGTVGDEQPAPSVPTITSITYAAVDSDDVVVLFVPGSGGGLVGTYDVRHRLIGAGSWTDELNIPAGQGGVTLDDYADGDQIEVQVRANNGTGTSVYSASSGHTVGSTKIPSVPSALNVTTPSPGTLHIMWTAPTGASYYGAEIFRTINDPDFYNTAALVHTELGSPGTADSYDITGATAGAVYRIGLKSRNEGGDTSPVTAPATVTAT
jgi:hypothetical protein